MSQNEPDVVAPEAICLEPPSIGLYVPCYNAAKYLPEVLPALLNQTLKPNEIIVVNDGSTDDTEAVARSFGIRVINHPQNRGLAATRNTAIRNLPYTWIASVDADVVAEPDWLVQMYRLVSRDLTVACGGRLKERFESSIADQWRAHYMAQSWGDDEVHPPFLFGCNTTIPRNALLASGLYNETFKRNGEDVDLSGKLKNAGIRLQYTPAALCWHLRKDGVRSIARTYWSWHHPTIPPIAFRDIGRNCVKVTKHFLPKSKESIKKINSKLFAATILLFAHWMILYAKFALRQGFERLRRPASILIGSNGPEK